MLLTCLGCFLFSISIVATFAREEYTDDDGEDYEDSPMDQPLPAAYDEEDEEDDRVKKVVRRAVRRYPEEAQAILPGNRQVSIPLERTVCECSEVLSKGTLGAIVAALAFLGFFCTSMLLVVIIWVLRMVEKQKKSKPPMRPLAPIPPPRPTATYMVPRRSGRLYATVQSGSPAEEGGYVTINEINPGPRPYQPRRYMSATPEIRPQEDEYIHPFDTVPQGSPPQGSPPQGSPPQGSPPQGSPSQGSPPRSSPFHGSPAVTTPTVATPTYVNLEPRSGPPGSTPPVPTYLNLELRSGSIPEVLSPSSGPQRGSDEHIYEEMN